MAKSRNKGKDNPMWKGGRNVIGRGVKGKYKYIAIKFRDHSKSDNNGYVCEHILIAERILGTFLPKGVIVHHIDNNGLNNAHNNLVICENNAYHRILHQRYRALKISGHSHWLKCPYCKEYDDPNHLTISLPKNKGYHYECKKRRYG